MFLEYHTEYNIMDITSESNLQKLPIGDLSEWLYFRVWGKNILVRSEEQLIQDNCWTLNANIYRDCRSIPLMNHHNIRQGTAWQDWQMFDCDTCGEIFGDKVIFSKIQREKINLEDHLVNCVNYLSVKIEKLKNYELPLVLSYSQGIDSLVILSYLHKYNYHKKVKLIYFTNPLGTIYDLDLSLERSLGFEVEPIEFNKDDIYGIINKKDAKILRCYITAWLLEKYANYSVITGTHGNPIFGHHPGFLYETKKKISMYREEIYSKELFDYDYSLNDSNSLSNFTLAKKPYRYINSYYNGRLNNILQNQALFDSVRSIDWSQVGNNVIIDADIARRIIHSNVGSLFDPLITSERNDEMDTLRAQDELDIDKLDPSILKKLKKSKVQNTLELEALNERLENELANTNKKITIQTVMTLLNIRRLDLSNT